jgi:hypothetical protein
MVFISVNAFCQNQDSTQYEQVPLSRNYRIDLGLFHPLANLRRSLGSNTISPSFGIYTGNSISEKWHFDAGFSVATTVNADSISFTLPDTTLKGKTQGLLMIGMWLTNELKTNKKILWDIKYGLGWGILSTDILIDKTKEPEFNVYGASTISFSIGTELKRVVFKKRLLGISVNYFFVPYNLFKNRLGNNFGKQHLTTTILYNF